MSWNKTISFKITRYMYKIVFIFQALHKISLRESVCTTRVCEVTLSLLSILIDFGVLVDTTTLIKSDSPAPPPPVDPNLTTVSSALFEEKLEKAKQCEQDEIDSDNKKRDRQMTSENSPKQPPKPESIIEEGLSIHNIFMDISIRLLKVLGCHHGCHDCSRSQITGSEPLEVLRNSSSALISRLLKFNQKQFKSFLSSLVSSKDVAFTLTFLHAYLGFCTVDPNNPFSPTTNTGTGNGKDKHNSFLDMKNNLMSRCQIILNKLDI